MEASSSSPSSSSSPPSLTTFAIAVMDESRNHKPGFLSREEERYLPLIKFFPASSAANEGFVYEGPHSTMSILRFIQKHLPEEERKEMEKKTEIMEYIAATNEETQKKLLSIYEQQRIREMRYDPTIVLFDVAPCGRELQDLMQHMILARYRSDVTEEEQKNTVLQREAVMKNFNECLAKSTRATNKFWTKIATLSKQQAELSKKALEDRGMKAEEEEEGDDEDEDEDDDDDDEAAALASSL